MSQLANFTEYHDYWQAIATSHVDITDFKFGDREVVQCAARSGLGQTVLYAENYDPVSILDSLSDNHTGNLNGVIYLIKKSPEAWADQRTVIAECEQIVKDILGKILKDFNDAVLQAELRRFRYGEVDLQLGSTQMLGIRLDVSFMRPERLLYNEAKWL